MRHDPGLAASPPSRYILEVERSEYSSFHLPSAVDGQPPREAAARRIFQQMGGEGRPHVRYTLGVCKRSTGSKECEWRLGSGLSLAEASDNSVATTVALTAGSRATGMLPSHLSCRTHNDCHYRISKSAFNLFVKGKQGLKEQRILSVRTEKGSLPPSKPTSWWMPLYPVSRYYRQDKQMEGESRWES